MLAMDLQLVRPWPRPQIYHNKLLHAEVDVSLMTENWFPIFWTLQKASQKSDDVPPNFYQNLHLWKTSNTGKGIR